MGKKYEYRKDATYMGVRYSVKADTEKELAKKIALKELEISENKKKLIGGNTTVEKWAETCFEQYKTNVGQLTLLNQRYKCKKWITSNIGNMQIKDVKPLDCQKIMNSMDGLALDTIRKTKQIMSWLFQKAIENGMISENPAKYITIPKAGKTTRRAITPEERDAIIKTVDVDPRYVYFLAMLCCGCRPSEAAELQGMDVQKVNGENMLHIRGTKTAAADRYVPIPDALFAVLPHVSPSAYIFTNLDGGKLSTSNRQALWRSFKRQLNITMGCKVYRNELMPPLPVADDLTPYCLRHTYCTDLQKMGIDIRTAQYLMGHADIRMTANIYTHTDAETLKKVAEKMRKNTRTAETCAETSS